MNKKDILFVDCETTGLDPDVHEIWEAAVGYWNEYPIFAKDESFEVIDHGWEWRTDSWFLPIDLGRADSFALKVGGFRDRYPFITHQGDAGNGVIRLAKFVKDFARISRGKHLTGMVPSFDEERLRKLLRANGECPEWHYHVFDLEAAVVGAMMVEGYDISLPWKSDELSLWLGVDPEDFDRHTARGDVKWSIAVYEALEKFLSKKNSVK